MGEQADERRMTGGWQTTVHERDGVVYRSPKPQSTTVLALLRHLRSNGFTAAPEVIGDGLAPDGREMLRFVPGAIQQPDPWDDEAIALVGELVRHLHDAGKGFDPPTPPVWQPWFTRALPGDRPVIGHGDLGPWNIVTRSGVPVALIDWDNAGPVDATWDLADAAWLNVQLHDDDIAERNGLPDAAGRAAQLRVMLDAYGLEHQRRDRFVDQLAELAIHAAADEAVQGGVTPTSTTAVDGQGFPVMWAVAWRARSASWILRHRDLLRRAVGA
ncbi:MAG TPA: phosphotransferase [Acidimicrobiales bacterium]|nr:phosphotransferase [Acidimicrobiales bacterium]